MAPAELDKMWDEWSRSLSASYAKVQDLLEQKKTAEAAQEYRSGFGMTVRKMYTEVSSAYPKRFEKMSSDEWSTWSRGLYIQMRNGEKAFAEAKPEAIAKNQAALREHFYALHKKTGQIKSNDAVYQLFKAAQGDEPKTEELKQAAEGLAKAEPATKAKVQAEAYAKARDEWSKAAEPILQDGKVAQDELVPLRQAAEKLYREFGIQFE